MSLFVFAGATEDGSKSGTAKMTASLIGESTKKQSAEKFNEAIDYMGSEFSTAVAQDYTSVSISGLSPYKDAMLELFYEGALRPAFNEKDFSRKKSELFSNLKRKKDNAGELVEDLYNEKLFAGHPYAHPSEGVISDLVKIQRKDVQQFYQQHYQPGSSMLVVTGQLTPEFKAKIKTKFSEWQGKEVPKISQNAATGVRKSEILLYTKPQLRQAEIRIGQLGISRSHPDFLKLRLANMAFGGSFATRLNQRVRDDLGLTYSISSAFGASKLTGDFTISTFTRFDKVKETLNETMNLLKEFANKGISQKELDASKALMIGQFPSAIETPEQLGFNLAYLKINGVPYTYLSDFITNVQKITLAEVNEAIEKVVSKDKHLIVVLSENDPSVMEQVKALGLPVQIQDVK
jgi:zinc protease